MAKLAPAPREPRQAEAAYIRDLTRVWGVAQSIIAYGLEPLLAVWPEVVVDSEAQPRKGVNKFPSDREDLGFAFRRDRRDPTAYNPLLPQPRRRPIAAMSDAELRRLWPAIDPADIRRHAPWATSRDEVLRVAYPGQPVVSDEQVQAFVRQSVDASKASPFVRPEPTLPRTGGGPPGPGAFQFRRRYQVPVVLDRAGVPLPPPPEPIIVNRENIARQMDWVRLQVGETVTSRHLEPILDQAGNRVDRWATRETKRVLGIDPRRDPMVDLQLRQWNLMNANLIESGVKGPWDGVRLRPLLNDVAEVVNSAHAQGLRVEVLAQDLKDRFGVSNSRAALIARDQTLKLNGQLNHSKQVQAGVTQYVWSTSKDERVRPEHEDLEGTTQSWSVPPDVGHPGQDYQCRCTARAIVPELAEPEEQPQRRSRPAARRAAPQPAQVPQRKPAPPRTRAAAPVVDPAFRAPPKITAKGDPRTPLGIRGYAERNKVNAYNIGLDGYFYGKTEAAALEAWAEFHGSASYAKWLEGAKMWGDNPPGVNLAWRGTH